MYGGLLIVYASINGFPLKALAKLARIGAWFMVAGSAIDCISVSYCTFRFLVHAGSNFMPGLSRGPICTVVRCNEMTETAVLST